MRLTLATIAILTSVPQGAHALGAAWTAAATTRLSVPSESSVSPLALLDQEAVDELLYLTRVGPVDARMSAIELLGEVGGSRAEEALKTVIAESDQPRLYDAAVAALRALHGQ